MPAGKKSEQTLVRYVRAHWIYFASVAVYFILVVVIAMTTPFVVQASKRRRKEMIIGHEQNLRPVRAQRSTFPDPNRRSPPLPVRP